MTTEKTPNKDRTTVAMKHSTLDRLKAYMKYGETVDGMVNKLLDFYELLKTNAPDDTVFQQSKTP